MYIVEKTTEFDKLLRKLKIYRLKQKSCFEFKKIEHDEHLGDCVHGANGIRE